MSALELVVIGAGRMGRTHIRALRSSAAVRVTAACDPDPSIRSELSGAGLAVHASVEQAVEARGFDAAIVALPTPLHVHTVRALAAAGVPILCEKPCGVTVGEAEEADRLATEAGVPLQVGYWRRFVPALARLRDEIASGSFGSVQWVSCFHWDGMPPPPSFRRQSGGILVDMGVHELDMSTWLTGQRIVGAVGRAATVGSAPPVPGDPESLAFVATLEGGGLLSVTLGRRHPPGDACRVQVIGTGASADVPFLWPGRTEGAFEEALRTQAEAFASWVRGGEARGATGRDAAVALDGARIVAEAVGTPVRPAP